MDFMEIFNIVLDLCTIYFSHVSGCWASFVCSCQSVPDQGSELNQARTGLNQGSAV